MTCIRRTSSLTNTYEFLDLTAATTNSQFWWPTDSVYFTKDCRLSDYARVLEMFLTEPWIKKIKEIKEGELYDEGSILEDLDVAMAEWKLSGKHK